MVIMHQPALAACGWLLASLFFNPIPTSFLKFITSCNSYLQWAFGITCWEVFTLGASPYSALDFEDMLLFIEKGSRLSKPQLCSLKV